MPCYGPLTGYRSAVVNESGKRSPVFDVRLAHSPISFPVPCGRCMGCRLEYSRQWAMRCFHEKKLHEKSCFVTLTYNRDELPEGGTLVKRDLQLFMKRARKKFGAGIRFFACGEYGDVGSRPHYHVLFFNIDFPDRKLFSGRDEHALFTSGDLTRLWSVDGRSLGLAVFGSVTFDSCAYVARYVTKKVRGKAAAQHYSRLDAEGRIFSIEPEFAVMSRGGRSTGLGGIGMGYFKRFGEEIFLHDSVLINGVEVPPPRYYDTLFQAMYPPEYVGMRDISRFAVIRRRRILRKILRKKSSPDRSSRVDYVIALKRMSLKARKL